jgi:hypothetical protein
MAVIGSSLFVIKIKMLKVNGQQTPSDGKSSHCLWQGQLKKKDLASL